MSEMKNTTEGHDPIVDRALEIFFQGREGWFDPELDRGSRSHGEAIRLLIDAGLFECRGCYDAKTATEWLRIHCRRCGAVRAEDVNARLMDVLPFAGLAEDGFANAATTIYRLSPHSVRRSGFGDWAIKAPEIASPDGEARVTPATLALLYQDCRPPGTFTIESHEFIQPAGGAVAVAAAKATATVGDITVNAIPDPELAKAIQMLASAAKKRSGESTSKGDPPSEEFSVREAYGMPDATKPGTASRKAIDKAFEKHRLSMDGEGVHAIDIVTAWQREYCDVNGKPLDDRPTGKLKNWIKNQRERERKRREAVESPAEQ